MDESHCCGCCKNVAGNPHTAIQLSPSFGPKQIIHQSLVEYTQNSTVHGIRYVFERHRHWTERLWWTIAFCLSVTGCGLLIARIWNKWEQNPVIVTFADRTTPIWAIPFPAVTICPQAKVLQSRFNFSELYHKMEYGRRNETTEWEQLRMMAISQVCQMIELSDIDNFPDEDSSNITNILRDLAPKMEYTLASCNFRQDEECDDYFNEVVTDDGMCFTFNAISAAQLYRDGVVNDASEDQANISATGWSMENGYPQIVTNRAAFLRTYPYRVFGLGVNVGLNFMLTLLKQDIEYQCSGPIAGYKILLHSPDEVPQMTKYYFHIPLKQEVLVMVKPNAVTTSPGLRGYKPHQRQCYFESERYLQFFRVYTQRNCELECLVNFTMKQCDCVTYGMPHFANTSICNASQIECYEYADIALQEDNFANGVAGDPEEKNCNCLPACTSISYDTEISQSKMDVDQWLHSFGMGFNASSPIALSNVNIFFKGPHFISSRRSELYGFTDFLANCGGLLGLFMGVSILGLVELLYYLTLRLCCNLRTRTGNGHRVQPLK